MPENKQVKEAKVKQFTYVLDDNPYFAFLYSRLIKKTLQEDSSSKHIIYPCYGVRFKECTRSKYPVWAKKLQVNILYALGEYKRHRRTKSLLCSELSKEELKNVSFTSVHTWFFYLLLAFIQYNNEYSHIKAKGISSEFANTKFNGILIGDLLIDTYLRYSGNPKFNSEDDFNYGIALRARALQLMYSSRLGPNGYILTGFSTYIQHGLPLRVGLSKDNLGITFGDYQLFCKLHKLDKDHRPSHLRSHYKYDINIAKKTLDSTVVNAAEKSLKSRVNGIYDNTMSYMSKNLSSASYGKKSNLYGKTVIYLHDFFDSPHAYEWMLFIDFWDWSYSTLSFCVQNGIEISVKPHPNQVPGNQEAISALMNIFSDTSLINWLDDDISSAEILSQGPSLIITACGSIAPEATYANTRVLLAGDHPGLNFNVGYVPNNKHDYFKIVKNPNLINIGSKEEAVYLTALHYSPTYLGSNQSILSKLSLSYKDIANNSQMYRTKEAVAHIDSEIAKLYSGL